jgi:adenylate cyclase
MNHPMETDDVERRLAAILSADAVGYSRLMAQDEGGTIRTVTAHRKAMAHCIERERGRVVDSPGDNLLAEFPTALEALRCAVEIQGVLAQRNAELPPERRMPFRIGVHLGDVTAESDRIYGDGVNVAARMEALAEPGGILISDLVLRQVRGKLDASYRDLGEKALKNIPDPVRVYGVTVGGQPTAPRASAGWRSGRAIVITAAVVALAGLFLWAAWPRVTGVAMRAAGLTLPDHPVLPDKPSIVVLPFQNMSGDPDQEYFSDGLTEELTAQLALSPTLFVIARNSAFTYKGQAINVEQVGRDLGVRFVVEGSVRKAGDRVRVTAQLIDATSGFHLWSERYDRDMADIFALQDEISARIYEAVGVQITAAEARRARRKPTEDLSAYEAWMRGYWHFTRFRIDEMAEARRWLERAIELDPEYAAAISLLGSTYSASVAMGWPVEAGGLDRALELANRAAALAPEISGPFLIRAGVYLNQRRSREAEIAVRKAIELVPNEAIAYVFLGVSLLQQGKIQEGLGYFRDANRINPRGSDTAPMKGITAIAMLRLGQKDEGVSLLEKARAANPDLVSFRIPLADHYEAVGEHEKAVVVVKEILSVNPGLTAEVAARSGFVARDDDEVPAMVENLRRAGLP